MAFKLQFILFLLIWLAKGKIFASDISTEHVEILQLNFDNFNETLKENSNVFVNFYTPPCPHCQRIKPIFIDLAKQMVTLKPNLKFAQVDVSKERDLAKQNNITGIPTLLLFREKRPVIEYVRQHNANQILEWLLRKIDKPVREITSIEESQMLLLANKLVIYGFFDNLMTEKARSFLTLADQSDEHVFAMTGVPEVIKYYHVRPNSVFLCKNYPLDDDVIQILDASTVQKLESFILDHKYPKPILEINESYFQKILGDTDYTRTYFFIFFSASAGHYIDDHITNVTQVCKETLQDRLYCATVDVDEEINQQFLKMFDVKIHEVPTIRFVFFGDHDKEISKMAGKAFDLENLRYFTRNLVETFFFKNTQGETLPDNWNEGPVKTLVKANYYDFIHNKDKDICILYHAEWNVGSKRANGIWKEIGKKYENDSTILIAKIDTSKNEFEATYYLEKLPTIRFFHRGGRDPINFKGTMEAKWIEKFIESHRSKPLKNEEKDEL